MNFRFENCVVSKLRHASQKLVWHFYEGTGQNSYHGNSIKSNLVQLTYISSNLLSENLFGAKDSFVLNQSIPGETDGGSLKN